MNSDLSIIIVNFNTEKFVTDCLNSLFEIYKTELESQQYEIIIVDNASTDSSLSLIQNQFPLVKTIKNEKNLGFSAANNIGIKNASGKYILLLNPDTIFKKQNEKTLMVVLDYLKKNPQVGIATCWVELSQSKKLDDAAHRGFPTPWRSLTHFIGLGKIFPTSSLFNGYHLAYQNMNQIHEIDACAGAFLMISRTAGEKVGWLDEDYFWYGEDLDLCFRVKEAGFKIMFIPYVSVIHLKGVSGGIKKESQHITVATKETRKMATTARFEAMRIFYRKHYDTQYPQWLTAIVLFGISCKEFITQKFL